jgi:uncharacterized protein (TIGR00369 family)
VVADMPPISSIETGEFQKLIGYEITDWGPGFAVIELELKDEHCNRHGNPHGGVLMTLLDAACTRAGTVDSETHEIGRASTISVSTNFISVAQGGKLRIEGKKTGGGRRLFFAEAQAYDEKGNLVASAVGTCRYASNAK